MRTKCHKTVSKSLNVTKTKLIVTFSHVHSTFELYHFKILKKLSKMDVPIQKQYLSAKGDVTDMAVRRMLDNREVTCWMEWYDGM